MRGTPGSLGVGGWTGHEVAPLWLGLVCAGRQRRLFPGGSAMASREPKKARPPVARLRPLQRRRKTALTGSLHGEQPSFGLSGDTRLSFAKPFLRWPGCAGATDGCSGQTRPPACPSRYRPSVNRCDSSTSPTARVGLSSVSFRGLSAPTSPDARWRFRRIRWPSEENSHVS